MIAYASRTGNVRYVVSKIQGEAVEIKEGLQLDKPYLLITYTDGFGDIPTKVAQFLEHNGSLCKGVVVSGNSNFGHHVFGGAGDKIVSRYQVPLVRKIELRGYQKDYEMIQQFYETRVM
ncbi:class Ib ribonucleoside-diphosphate reductase assembly flavoprotein NrdI [Ureibacillus chungkukjangi]|uniref:Protein involved in ribonucleotide reduction n=1 Tax=Ureibacillus chungkukjangi TaxID=1202712 RepID=A0A318TP79_9BACL|nr:class Ib ribonucleoside-diphosphate reductase assembly flavoprotein NrdI [Ureibacillus chungkukjangi]MCM3388782.1 class Ib ribonucleoside-diphosphate reductase assembly flavoprotein NrdI [Ureibacillus chungkukjangi]PYF06691.1 protein involved in ribonucleotide reduction [Ureibacillus chungkukjangi]